MFVSINNVNIFFKKNITIDYALKMFTLLGEVGDPDTDCIYLGLPKEDGGTYPVGTCIRGIILHTL